MRITRGSRRLLYLVLSLTLLGGGAHLFRQRHYRDFNPTAWRENVATNPMWPPRLRRVDDLLARHSLMGRTRTEVEQLLGPADRTDCVREWDLVYWLGPERGLIRIDSEWLVLRLDPQQRVSEYRIARD